jgi:hypothetical protein
MGMGRGRKGKEERGKGKGCDGGQRRRSARKEGEEVMRILTDTSTKYARLTQYIHPARHEGNESHRARPPKGFYDETLRSKIDPPRTVSDLATQAGTQNLGSGSASPDALKKNKENVWNGGITGRGMKRCS